MSDHNECPTCLQDWVANTDYECGCCGRPASEHIRVTSLCRILRETQQREHTLERERDAERALADRLAGVLELYYVDDTIAHHAGIANAITAWKEARND